VENIGQKLREANDAIRFAEDIQQMETYRKLEAMREARTVNDALIEIGHVG